MDIYRRKASGCGYIKIGEAKERSFATPTDGVNDRPMVIYHDATDDPDNPDLLVMEEAAFEQQFEGVAYNVNKFTLTCKRCANTRSCVASSMSEARERAEKAAWLLSNEGEYCPDCA